MKCSIENEKLIIENDDGKTYSFTAHAEAPRPSLFGISAGGRHWSNRDPEIKIEKHTSIQDLAVSDRIAVWYTQEFLPDGVDYKISKNAKLYVGDLMTGEDKLIYKGECYGDMVIDGTDIYFNMGNKVAVIHTESGECEVLFKHSGIKKNGIQMLLTPKRIFFIHWTHDKTYLMWYDRETKEVINPHIDSNNYCIIDENMIAVQSLYHIWLFDMTTMKKKRLLSDKRYSEIMKMVCDYFGIPQEYYENFFETKLAYFKSTDNGRIRLTCKASYISPDKEAYRAEFDKGNIDPGFDRNNITPDMLERRNAYVNSRNTYCYNREIGEVESKELPYRIHALISCDLKGSDLRMSGDKDDIVRRKTLSRYEGGLTSPFWYDSQSEPLLDSYIYKFADETEE